MFWLQDLHSVAMTAEAEKRVGRMGRCVGASFEALERRLLRQADGVVSITDDFAPTLAAWGVDEADRTVIENWAPLADLPVRRRDNEWRAGPAWATASSTSTPAPSGLKHRPELLYRLAAQRVDDAEVVVISQGMGEARLRERLRERPLPNLRLLPFQPMDQYPDVLAAADVLVALLEPTAGTYSVPSKVLSYLCAGRHPGGHPAREPRRPHHRAGGRRLDGAAHRRGGVPGRGQAAAGRPHHASGGGPPGPRLR